MNDTEFRKKILEPLLVSSNSGDSVNEMGTQLVGHSPDIAPRAYRHVIYKPLDNAGLKELYERINVSLPIQLTEFLSNANGMLLFNGAIRVFGFVPLKRTAENTIHNYPPDIIAPNVSSRIKGLAPCELVVGWYKSDGSYVFIQEDGGVARFDALGDGKIMKSWSSFDSWLTSEIKEFNDELMH